jgi:hypothetical protein
MTTQKGSQSPHNTIVRLARPGLICLVLGLLLAIGLIVVSQQTASTLRQDVNVARGNLDAQQQTLDKLNTDLSNIKEHVERFTSLKDKGLVGAIDREGWIEQLLVARTMLRLPDTLIYKLNPPQAYINVEGGAEEMPVDASALDASASASVAVVSGPQFHDLDIAVSNITEDELFRFLTRYKENVRGQFRVQECQLDSPGSDGLSAKCQLRFFNVPEGVPAP